MRPGLANEILELTAQHLALVLSAMALATALGVPAGILLTRRPPLRRWLLGFASVVQTIPSLALFGFLIPIPLIGGIVAERDPALNSPYIQSIAIARHGKLVLDQYFYGLGPNNLHDVRSAGKSVTTLMVGRAIQETEAFSPSSPVLSLLSPYRPVKNDDARKERLTVADLMTWLAGRGEEYAFAFENPKVIRAAINRTHVKPNAAIAGAKEVAFFPPMTGG